MTEDPFQDLSPIEPEPQFTSQLQPETIDAGQNAQLMVTNEGQVSESFTVNWESQDDLLAFEVWGSEGDEFEFKETRTQEFEVEPRAEQIVHFRAGLRKRPYFGGQAAYPFQIQVASTSGYVVAHDGQVNERGIIPIWLLPLLLVLCLCLVCSGVIFFSWWGGQDDTTATQTAVAETVLAEVVEQTLIAEATQSAQLTAGAPTNTAEPTATFTLTTTPTDTPEPTDTPLPTETGVPTSTATPTFTVTPTEIPTATPTEVATDTPEPTEHPGADLLGITWVLEGYLADIGDDELTESISGVDVNLIFEEDFDITGNSGCNSYSGRYVTNGTQIAFQNIIATKILCTEPEGIMEQETLYLSLLDNAEEYRINQDDLLEIIRKVIEDDQEVEKVILLFYDLSIGPP